MIVRAVKKAFLGLALVGAIGSTTVLAQECSDKLFSVTINESLSIADALDNLAETCGLTVIVKDSGAQHRLQKKLYYVKLKNASLKSFLDTILKDNDLNYTLNGNKLTISYLVTRTFKVHYVTGKRTGESSANVQVAGGSSSENSTANSGKGSTVTIKTNNEFQFWNTIKEEIHRILNTAGDGSVHFTKVDDGWIGPDGQKWEYNPLEPVVNPEAGMVTVTGTARQIERVSRYISTLMKQIKTEVMIDVRILDVRIDNSKSMGIDWSKIYNTSIGLGGAYGFTAGKGIVDQDNNGLDTWGGGSGGSFTAVINGDLTGILKFLKTQGDVTTVSSPRVMTLNNQPAMISVGQEIFYRLTTTNKVGGSDTATSEDQTIESVFAGILLDITPEVDERGLITLKINPSITSLVDESQAQLAPGEIRAVPPDLKRRQISAVIKVHDGEHAILGGLITKNKGTQTDQIPVLGQIPILGNAFKRKEVIDYTDELVIIITPHIVKNGGSVSLKELGYKTLR